MPFFFLNVSLKYEEVEKPVANAISSIDISVMDNKLQASSI